MSPMLSAALGAIIRAGISVLAGYLVKSGIWKAEDAEGYVVGATVVLLTVGWSIWTKYQGRVKFLTALALPKGTTEQEVTAYVAEGAPTPSISTPADMSPKL